MSIEEKLEFVKDFLEAANELDSAVNYETFGIYLYPNDEVDDILCELFVDPSKRYDNIIKASSFGLRVYPGDQDSFGWLTGICELASNPKIRYCFG